MGIIQNIRNRISPSKPDYTFTIPSNVLQNPNYKLPPTSKEAKEAEVAARKASTPFVSGGGGGGSSSSTSTSGSTTPSSSIVSNAIIKAAPTPSPQVLATQQRAALAAELRAEAKQRNIDISTPARQQAFIQSVSKRSPNIVVSESIREDLLKKERKGGKEGREATKALNKIGAVARITQLNYLTPPQEESVIPSANVPQRPIPKIKEVNLLKTFFPDIAKQQGKTQGITLQTYEEAKGKQGLEYLGQKTLKIIPEGRLKNILSYKLESPGLVTGISKFSAFSPFLSTSQQALAKAIQSGELKPIVETRFKAQIEQADDILKSKIVSVSKSGGKTTATVSSQEVIPKNNLFVSRGKAVTASKISTGKIEYVKSDVLGIGKEVGEARQVVSSGIFRSEEVLGYGTETRAAIIDTAKVVQRRGIGGINTRTNLPSIKDTKFTLDAKTGEKLTGVLLKSKEGNLLKFVGTTNKPTIAISRYGIVKRIPFESVNVKGVISTGNLPETVIFGSPESFLGEIQQTKMVSSIAPSVLKSAKALTKGISYETTKVASNVFPKIAVVSSSLSSVPSTKLNTKGSTQIETESIPLVSAKSLTDQTAKNIYTDQTINRVKDLGVLGTGFKTIDSQKSPQKIKLSSRLKENQKAKTATDQITRQLAKENERQKERTALNLRQLQKQKLELKETFIPTIRLPFPRPEIKSPPYIKIRPRLNKITKTPKSYTVSIRRFGKFIPIGKTNELRRAFEIGRQRTSTTLGATFRIQGLSLRQPGTPKGYYSKSTKKGLLFIERPSLRLSTPGEIFEIQKSRRRR